MSKATAATTPRIRSIAIVGGDGRHDIHKFPNASVRCFPSERDGGRGDQKALLATVRSGSIDLVVVLVRWFGHAQFRTLREACRLANVRMVVAKGGVSTIVRAIDGAFAA